ncbi:elongation factor G [Anaerorhabdus furcosa]|uniref:Elongation factor G n=1 Tax=Anaerorhabdus furcosa TaxID=118967 RepID=A0A1T4PV35_9FIRM|nr:elongation factor G [Anaerorhabdus furcosa]SJZ95412.1 elongation factor G [Anaerorhabdus furcosa]
MRDYLANEVRNIVLLGHSGAGKTSVVEAALYYTKNTDRMGSTIDGTSTLDYDAEEVKRGLSVYTSLAPIEWKNCKINFIDTPGYLDYEGEMLSGLTVGDNALIVVGAKDGVQSGTERAWKQITKRKLPTIFFINKIDEENASFDNTYNQLRDTFGKTVIPFEVPITENGKVVGSINILRNKAWYHDDKVEPKEVPDDMKDIVEEYYNQIAEAIAMTDDALMEKFFSGERFDEDEVAKGLRIGVRNGDIRPVYCGSAVNQTGIERLMDLITEYFPSYAEIGHIHAYNEKGEVIDLETNEQEAMSAMVFKTIVDPFVGKISFIKVLTGVMSSDSQVLNAQKGETEKIAQIFVIKGKYQVAIGKLFTGDIGAVVKLQYTDTNDTLCTKNKVVTYSAIEFPQPMLGVAIWPKTKADEDKLSFGLQKMTEEDPSVRIVKNAETKETILYGMGDQHINVILSKLKSKYKVDVETTKPKVQYRETIRSKAEAEGKHKKQSGGAGQYGHVKIRFEPCESEEMVFEEDVFGGAVPRQYFPAVEAGLRECMEKGVLAGYKVVGVKAVLYDGSYHEVDSKEIAFKSAARLAYKDGMPKAKPIILEPIGKVDVIAPEEYTGTIIGDFNKRRGIIVDTAMVDEKDQKITAEVPMAEMQVYATELRSMTQGRGTYIIEFDRYEPAPQPVADKVIKETVLAKEEEE